MDRLVYVGPIKTVFSLGRHPETGELSIIATGYEHGMSRPIGDNFFSLSFSGLMAAFEDARVKKTGIFIPENLLIRG